MKNAILVFELFSQMKQVKKLQEATIKTILAALDQNLETIKDVFSAEESDNITISINNFQILNWAFIIGIIYFIVGFVEYYIDADLKITKSINFSTSYLSI